MSAETLKTLTGGDTLPGRRLYGESFNFEPTHNLLLVSNDPPRLNAFDDALKSRLWVVQFEHKLDNGNGVFDLFGGKRIEAVRSDPKSGLVRGFLKWALEGLWQVQQSNTIKQAPQIRVASQRFFDNIDSSTEFWASDFLRGSVTYSEFVHSGYVPPSALYSLYIMWCDLNKLKPISLKQWPNACKSAGLVKEKGGLRRWHVADRERFTARLNGE